MIRPLRHSVFLLLVALMTQVGCGGGTKDANPDANAKKADLPLEPLPSHPQIELSNLRFGRGRTGKEKFSVDWRLTKKGEFGFSMTLIIKRSTGTTMTRPLDSSGKTSGKVSAELLSNASPGQEPPTLESGCEMYVVIQHQGTHKISNSVTSGNASVTPTRPPKK